MKGLKMLSVLAFMAFSFTANASSQIQDENEVTTTSTEVATSAAQASDDEGTSLLKSKEDVWGRRKYFNINLVTSQDRKVKGVEAMKDSKDWAVGLTLGRTFYVHKKPILNMIKVGIDWTYLDLTYAKYKKKTEGYKSTEFYGDQQAEYAMAIGPSVTVNPIDHLKVGAYLRYMPACSAIFTDDDVNFQFASGGQFGMQASWKMIALGFESRWQSAKYKCLKTDEYKEFIENNPSSKKDMDKKTKLKTNSFRFFIGFRF